MLSYMRPKTEQYVNLSIPNLGSFELLIDTKRGAKTAMIEIKGRMNLKNARALRDALDVLLADSACLDR